MVRKSITVTDKQESWIKSQMANGNYGTDSELIREALREKQNRVEEIEYIRAKLIASEKSGFTRLSRAEILEISKKELRDSGEL